MTSFRVDQQEAADATRWAEHLSVGRSELLREALHRHLTRLRAEHDTEAWPAQPLTIGERSLGEIADCGPAEHWKVWADRPVLVPTRDPIADRIGSGIDGSSGWSAQQPRA